MGTRGKLRVYLGAAPGVGKTYAMLGEGHRRAERGTDVVVGFVETHGRRHTAEMAEGLELVPRKTLLYRGARFEEMDVDAVLARRPKVALVDELAHTNVPGSRNDKRWQDIEELLAAGIEVITTVNIQHLESVNDVVEKITGVPQRETVPDSVVRAADQIELEDMTAEALRRRLAHGNVYAPEKVDAALSNYFRTGNLNALRELALLWTADRVDDALQDYREKHGITGHLGGPGAGRGRADRWPRGRDADPSRGPDRGQVQRRRPARRPRRPLGRALRREPGSAGVATAPGRVPRRHLPPGARRRRARGPALVRPRGERHPARAGREPSARVGTPAHPGHREPHRPPSPETSTSTSSPTPTPAAGSRSPTAEAASARGARPAATCSPWCCPCC